MKKIAFACDHRGFEIKKAPDFSAQTGFIFNPAEGKTKGTCEKAIGVCYTGIGSCIAASKVKGVRAAIVKTWLETLFEGKRHAGRVDQIREYEQKHSR